MTIKNSCLVVLFAFVAVVTNSVVSYAMSEKPKSPDKQRQEAIKEFEENEKFQKQPICKAPLIVKIAGTSLSFSGDRSPKYLTTDGKIYNYMNHRCEIKILDNVVKIMYPTLTIAKYSSDIQTELEMQDSIISKYRFDKKSTYLSGGIERAGEGRQYIYIFPSNLIPKDDNEKVAFTCHSGDPNGDASNIYGSADCTTRYRLSPDLIVSYTVFGGDKPAPSEEIIKRAAEKVYSLVQSQSIKLGE